ncbi:hypothetical protein BSIN_0384 [Burkholderia singularis]|uniref:Uncharacterized protein n=1 Tax=Burkholderia singularis TaxID=1503053 RepID=A0A238H688_9BURK|nr:hypothetical protein BSIN_0384 [Burkholderia singularis]
MPVKRRFHYRSARPIARHDVIDRDWPHAGCPMRAVQPADGPFTGRQGGELGGLRSGT